MSPISAVPKYITTIRLMQLYEKLDHKLLVTFIHMLRKSLELESSCSDANR